MQQGAIEDGELSLALTVSECVADEDEYWYVVLQAEGLPAGGFAYAGLRISTATKVFTGRAEQAGKLRPSQWNHFVLSGGGGGGGDASSGTLSLQLETPCFDGCDNFAPLAANGVKKADAVEPLLLVALQGGADDDAALCPSREAATFVSATSSLANGRAKYQINLCYSGSAEYFVGVQGGADFGDDSAGTIGYTITPSLVPQQNLAERGLDDPYVFSIGRGEWEFHYFRMPDPECAKTASCAIAPAAAAQCNPMVWDDDAVGGPAYVDNGELPLSDVGVVGGCTPVVAGTNPPQRVKDGAPCEAPDCLACLPNACAMSDEDDPTVRVYSYVAESISFALEVNAPDVAAETLDAYTALGQCPEVDQTTGEAGGSSQRLEASAVDNRVLSTTFLEEDLMREYAEFELRAQLAKANGQYETCMAPILSCGQYAPGETIAGAGGATVLAADCCFEPKIFIGIRGVMTDGKAHSARLRPTLVCGAGNMPDGNTLADACKPCPAGTEKPLGQKMCTAVPAGSAAENKGTARCSRCKPGTYQRQRGADRCELCLPGRFEPNFGSLECVKCPVNAYQPESGSAECEECPDGSVSDGAAVSPQDCYCPAGFLPYGVVGKNADPVDKQQNLRLQNGSPLRRLHGSSDWSA